MRCSLQRSARLGACCRPPAASASGSYWPIVVLSIMRGLRAGLSRLLARSLSALLEYRIMDTYAAAHASAPKGERRRRRPRPVLATRFVCGFPYVHQDDMTAAFGLVAAVGPVHARCAVSTEDPVRRVRFRRRRRLQRGRAGRATLRAPINIVLTTPEYSAATRDEDLLPLPRSPGPRPSCPLQCCCINSPRRASGEIDRVICPQNRRINLDTATASCPLPLPLSHPHFSGLLLRCSPPAHGATGKAVH